MSEQKVTAEPGAGRASAAGGGTNNHSHSIILPPKSQAALSPLDKVIYYANQVLQWYRANNGVTVDETLINASLAEFTDAFANELSEAECKTASKYVWQNIQTLPVERQADAKEKFYGISDYEPLEALCEAVGVPPYGSTWRDMESLVGDIAWEWEGWLPRGVLTLVAGEPGQGKSVLVLRMAASYLRGDPWPNGAPFDGDTGAVLWCESEAAQALNLDRAKRWGLPLERIYTPMDNPLEDVQLDKTEHQEAVEKVAARPDVRLIIVDSLRGAHRRDENSSVTMEVVKWLAELSRNLCKPVLLTHHLRKRGMLDVGDRVTLDRIRGSSAIIQTARMVWAIDSPDLEYEDSKRLSVIKSNLARFPEPIGFTIGDEMRLTFGDAPEAPRQESQLDKAIDLLKALLTSGPVASVDLRDEAEGAGLSWDTMKRAKNKMGIVAKRDGKSKQWSWALPAKDIVH